MTPDAPHGPHEAASPEEVSGASYGPKRRRAPDFGRRRQLRNRLLRAVLLLALVSGVGGLTAMFLQGREERAPAEPAAAPGDALEIAEEPEAIVETAQLSAEEFESTLEREGVEVFRIRGAQTSSDDQGNVNLSQVEVDYPQGDDHYSLRADGATYNEETSATHLQGSVALEGTNGLGVATDWMELAEGGMVLTAADDSRFSFEGVTVQGDDLRMDFREEIARMGGGVRLAGTDAADEGVEADASQSVSLAAQTLEYRWGAGIVRALGGAELRLGSFTLAARALTMQEGETGGIAGIEARGEIELRAPLGAAEPEAESAGNPADESVLVLRGDALDVRFDDLQSPSRVDLSGPSWGGPAVLRIDYGDGSQRRIRARLLEFRFVEGVLSDFSSRGRVELHELAPGRQQPLREASSVIAGGRFDPEGVLAELTLGGNVELTDRSEAPVTASADEATIDPSTQRVDFRGRPAKLVHSQGALEGSRVLYDQAKGCSEARGAVRLTLRGNDTAGGALPFGRDTSDSGPSVITAGEALICEGGESRFRDGVEVRRGPDHLAAAQLRITEDRRRIIANGDVRTVWHAPPAAKTRTSGEAGTESAPERWSIAAARMNYDEDSGELRYSGGAAAVLGEQSLECEELTVEAIPGSQDSATGGLQARTLFCLGNARLDVLGDGGSVEANRAIYAFADRMIRLSGNVVFREGADELRGPGLVYWIDQRRYEMRPPGGSAAGAGDP
ncbi:MAG: hypothetical protein OYL92_09635 [Acidobacteriota bacterium]|nr:hypothetical protein [Acidobacteriota bacterium]MDE3265224.1 hypothetical protein [Acidobacteriota bacterium]